MFNRLVDLQWRGSPRHILAHILGAYLIAYFGAYLGAYLGEYLGRISPPRSADHQSHR